MKTPTKPAWWPEDQPWRPLICEVCYVDISTAGHGVGGHLYCPAHGHGDDPEQLELAL